jgi:hypothetical protein
MVVTYRSLLAGRTRRSERRRRVSMPGPGQIASGYSPDDVLADSVPERSTVEQRSRRIHGRFSGEFEAGIGRRFGGGVALGLSRTFRT